MAELQDVVERLRLGYAVREISRRRGCPFDHPLASGDREPPSEEEMQAVTAVQRSSEQLLWNRRDIADLRAIWYPLKALLLLGFLW